MDWWSLQYSLSWQRGQPLKQGQVGKAYCFPIFGSCSVINWVPSGESSVVALIRQWNGHPKSRSKLVQPIIWTWSSTSPALKSSARFSNTPIVESMLVFANIIWRTWLEWRGNLSSSQTHFGIATTSDPESSMPMREWQVPGILASRAWRGRLWCMTMSLSSFLITWLLYSHATTKGSRPESSLTCTTWEEGLVVTCLTVMSSWSCFLNSGATMSKSFTGMGTLEPRTRSRTCLGAVSSSMGNKYWYCAAGTSGWLAGRTQGGMVPVNLDWANDNPDWEENCPDWPVEVRAGTGTETGTEGRSAGLALAFSLEGWSKATTGTGTGVALAAHWSTGDRTSISSDTVAQHDSGLGALS